ncbi:MAG: GAF domain-containing sensor histidine kinase [Chitinophagaceae bacterium]|nr:GAF domain-containing sensor histidine kinase [Anaerolineae bacterium]
MVLNRPIGRLEDQDRDQLLQTARRLLAEADALSSRISAVNEIGIAINRTLDLTAIQQVIARQAKWLLDFDHCSVCLQKDDTWQINTLFGPQEANSAHLLETENVGRALKHGQPQIVREGSPSPVLAQYASQIIIPLVADGILLGTINFALTKSRGYTQDDMRIGYMLALQLSSALRNTRNFEELERTRDELQNRALELEARNQELDAYSHTIAHDLKSPLNNIMLRSEMLASRFSENLPTQALEFLKGMRDSSVKMNEMIDQLLWLAKLRDLKEAVKPVAITPAVNNALLRFAHILEEKGIRVELSPEMPSVLGQNQWLEEVFANLISNAIKYMGKLNPAPRIMIRALLQGDCVRCEVQDTGIGIAPADQARLFEMFTRLHTVNVEGLGLGLSIVHRIVTKLNGQIGVESTLDVGSTFWFTLPSAPKVDVEQVIETEKGVLCKS